VFEVRGPVDHRTDGESADKALQRKIPFSVLRVCTIVKISTHSDGTNGDLIPCTRNQISLNQTLGIKVGTRKKVRPKFLLGYLSRLTVQLLVWL
jgi:hypothetical protein